MTKKKFAVVSLASLFVVTAMAVGVRLNAPAAPADGPISLGALRSSARTPAWRADPVWRDGRAEWALYDAIRPIYGRPRSYEATIFTNTQRMDPETTVKTDGAGVEVFKQNVSEIIPTDRYDYRFLTTTFSRFDDLAPVKLAFSSQEDCGSTYKEILVDDGSIRAVEHCYFPGAGRREKTMGLRPSVVFHDQLSLTLRDFPFDDPRPVQMKLIPDQTDTHSTSVAHAEAVATYVGRETIELPYGAIDAHHLRVTHDRDGGAMTSDFWFAADAKMQNVMVQYRGPYGVAYELKQFGRWAYWDARDERPDKRG